MTRCMVWAVLFGLIAASAYAVQTGHIGLDSVPDEPPPLPPVPPRPAPGISGSVCAHDIQELNGVVTVKLEDRQRVGQVIQLIVDGYTYHAAFDGAGHLTTTAPLLHRRAEIAWPGLNGQPCSEAVAFQTYDTITAAAVVWTESYDLALHVLEPDGQTLDRDWARPDAGRTSGQYGQVRAFGAAGGIKILLYTLPPDQNHGADVIYFLIEFASRGNPTRPPYCGDDERAAAAYNFIVISQPGRRVSRELGFKPAACGHVWQRGGIGYEDWQSYQERLRQVPG